MVFRDMFEVMYTPEKAWPQIKAANRSSAYLLLRFVLPLSLMPPLAGFVGSTYVGWHIAGSERVVLTTQSGAILSLLAWLGLVVAITVGANFIRWMAKTYGANPEFRTCYALAAYSATPLFVVGLLGAYPILWLDALATLAALALSIRILFAGVPVMMDIPPERGYLFASSILAVAMVLFVGLLAVTVLFWGFGIAPVFAKAPLY
jgi:hypothetical protein